ncbi:hypothetical protein I4U23_026385 [Adineta vaga]|nr:hypothetical protein I4U23_026385 [Adineta vaga]
MHVKIIYRWCYEKLRNYNVFIPEENEYDNDDEVEAIDPLVITKLQKYSTWLYILLFLSSLYLLFFITLINPQSRRNVISSINPVRFEELYQKYNKTLSLTYDPVCKSTFVSSEWIKALYLENASRYGMLDFRTTANSQLIIPIK